LDLFSFCFLVSFDHTPAHVLTESAMNMLAQASSPRVHQGAAPICPNWSPLATYYTPGPSLILDFAHRIVNSNVLDDDLLRAVFTAENLVPALERLFKMQQQFRAAGKPTLVDIGFHYTRQANVASIQ
jgi:hypothetical protein